MLAPPSPLQRSRELLLGREFVRLAVALPSLANRSDEGGGQPVILVPGFGADDTSLIVLRRFLARRGYDTHSARLGRVGDDVMALADRVAERVAVVGARAGRPVALVGWSIGGVLSREAARDNPTLVTEVITMGTPAEGGPSYTSLAWRYTEAFKAEIRAQIDERSKVPITVPITALWSRNDGIVTPEACIDRRSPNVEHIEVRCTHLGFGFDPTVLKIVAGRLGSTAARQR
jgi:dienelactone hydrolase